MPTGKQPKLTASQQAGLARMHATGEYNTIAELMGVFVGRATGYRNVERLRTYA